MRRYLCLLMLLFPGVASAQIAPWRATLYGGTITRLNTTQIFLHGHYRPDGSQIGVALSRDLAPLGSGFTLVGEGGAMHQVAKGDETTVNLGLGLRYDLEFLSLPVGISAFTGGYSHGHMARYPDQLPPKPMAELCGHPDRNRAHPTTRGQRPLRPSFGRVRTI